MLGRQLRTILARTDPFDVAQGLERHIRSLSGDEVRGLILAARERMGDWYRAEFLPLLDELDDARLKSAFTRSLKSNLRAIPLFGAAFCEGVISEIPGDRTVGLGEEAHRWRPLRPVAFAIIALALVIGGAAAQRVLSSASATAQTPVVLVTPFPVAASTPVPVAASTPVPVAVAARPKPAATHPPAHATSAPAPRVIRRPPPGRGVKTIVVTPPSPSPAPQPAALDLGDMPQAYSDATPLPKDATAPPAQVPTRVRVPTPAPAPRRGSWLHRTIMHLDPFKPHPHATP